MDQRHSQTDRQTCGSTVLFECSQETPKFLVCVDPRAGIDSCSLVPFVLVLLFAPVQAWLLSLSHTLELAVPEHTGVL